MFILVYFSNTDVHTKVIACFQGKKYKKNIHKTGSALILHHCLNDLSNRMLFRVIFMSGILINFVLSTGK